MRLQQGKRITLGLALAIALALGGTLLATSVTLNGITLTFPGYTVTGPAFQTCDPSSEPAVSSVTLDGLEAGSNVTLAFAWAFPFAGDILAMQTVSLTGVAAGHLVVPVPYPTDSTFWPIWDVTTNERAIAVVVTARIVSPAGLVTRLTGKKWWMRCQPPVKPFEGCTPGYWRQDQHFDSWVGLMPTDDFETVFAVNASFDPHTLLDAVWLGGGGENALARHAVAALLNAMNPNVNYAYTPAQIISWVQGAYVTGNFEALKTQLDFANNAGCPLN